MKETELFIFIYIGTRICHMVLDSSKNVSCLAIHSLRFIIPKSIDLQFLLSFFKMFYCSWLSSLPRIQLLFLRFSRYISQILYIIALPKLESFKFSKCT